MEFFRRAKAVRLRSQHKKYMVAEEDEEGVKQSRTGSSKAARWVVEPVEGKPDRIRLKSCQSWKYLSASDEHFLLGMTGKKVLQSSPRLRRDAAVEWEPIKEGVHVKLRTHRGNFLRANGGIPPWMNSVTHDVPSRSATQDWILWTVDVLEVDYESTVGMEASIGSNVVDPDPGRGSDGLSRSSSYSSSVSKTEEHYKDYYEVGSPARSVRSSVDQIATPSPKASAKPAGVSPHLQHIRHESQHSNSFNKLKSMLDGLQDLLDDPKEESTKADAETPSHPHPLEVNMAKQTLKELTNMDLNNILSSGRDKKLENAINILIADAKTSLSKPQTPNNLADLLDRLKSMKTDHDSASQDLVECTTFGARRLEAKAELKKDAAKAHELETLEVGFTNMLVTARAKREELLRQLEEVENSIKAAERAQADNAVEIEALISRIGMKSEGLREMEKEEKTLQVRRFEAERTLERVEEEWVQVKTLFLDV